MDPPLQGAIFYEETLKVITPLRNVCISLLILNTVFFCLRFISVLLARTRRLKLTWDDWLLIPAYVLLVFMLIGGFMIHHSLSQFHGSPNEMIYVPDIFVPTTKTVFALSQLVTPTFAFTRWSILALFIRIFYRPYVRIISWCLIAFVACQVIAFNIALATQCIPTSYFWNRIYDVGADQGGHCVDIDAFYRSFQGPEMLVDLVIIMLPLPEIWRLRSSNTRKLGLSALFLTGIIAFIANCYRQYIFVKYQVTWATARVNTATISWVIIEPSVCFIAACLPAMHPLTSKFMPSRWKSHINTRNVRTIEHVAPGLWATIEDDTRQLMSDLDRAGTPASPSEPPRAYGFEAKAIRSSSTNELEAAVFPSVPLQDWRQVSSGGGVLVKTEISVTQEDIIQDVLGF